MDAMGTYAQKDEVTGGFNPRARDGRDNSARQISRLSLCFNPRARDGRDDIKIRLCY